VRSRANTNDRRRGRAFSPGAKVIYKRSVSKVNYRAVPCPTCLAPIAEPCISSTGMETGYHYARQRIATRRHNEEEA
jgi:hypothetical protein